MQIKIRKYAPTDVDALLEAVLESHQELSRWMTWFHPQYGRIDAESWINGRPAAWDNHEEWAFVIVDEHDRFLGTCGIHRIDLRNGVAEMGYWVRTGVTGRGVATSAATAISDWALGEMGLHRIEIIAAVANRASQRVAVKAGAVHEGTLRKRVRIHHQWHDAELFAIVKDDDSSN